MLRDSSTFPGCRKQPPAERAEHSVLRWILARAAGASPQKPFRGADQALGARSFSGLRQAAVWADPGARGSLPAPAVEPQGPRQQGAVTNDLRARPARRLRASRRPRFSAATPAWFLPSSPEASARVSLVPARLPVEDAIPKPALLDRKKTRGLSRNPTRGCGSFLLRRGEARLPDGLPTPGRPSTEKPESAPGRLQDGLRPAADLRSAAYQAGHEAAHAVLPLCASSSESRSR